jgi:hypothetical protein
MLTPSGCDKTSSTADFEAFALMSFWFSCANTATATTAQNASIVFFISFSPCPRFVSLPRVGLALVQCRPLRYNQTRIKGKIKASLRVSMEAVRMALLETRREAKRCSVFLCKVSSNFETSHISQNDRFAAMQIVMVTKRLLRHLSVLLSY